MIDLSFLTEEEQEAIMKVLQRDAVLKRAEEERVRHLPEKIKDDKQLKNMSGQWFYEAKAKRHKDKIHGADIIRASMRKKRLQVAAEQSKDSAIQVKKSWVNNVNKDAFLPPEQAGVVEDPEENATPASTSVVNPAPTVTDKSQEKTRTSTVSPAKQRKNPFNSSKLPEDHLSQQTKNEQSKNGRAGLFQISKEGELSESKEKSSITDVSSQKVEESKQTVPTGPVNGSQIKPPVPKARKLISKSNDLKQDDSQSFLRQRTDSLNARGAPRGILKRNSSSSSTDSETLRLNHNFESKSKTVSPGLTIHEQISEKEHSLDDSSSNSLEPLKHVRFSAVKDELPQSPGLVHGREMGEFSVLESDRLKNGTEDAGDIDEFQDNPKPSHRKPMPFYPSTSSPGASNNKTHQPMTSYPLPNNGLHSHSEVQAASPQSIENSSTIIEHQDKSSELTRLESKLSKSPADELSHCVEPEPSQVSDLSSRDHQQGKPPLLMALKAKRSSHSGSYASEIRKTTDDSISKVLDWFNRSSNSDDDSKLPLQHPQGTEPKEITDSNSQVAIALVKDATGLKESDSESLSFTKVKLKPTRSDSASQVEGDMLLSENCQDNDVNIKSKFMNSSQQGIQRKDLEILQPFKSYGTPSQRSESMDYSQGLKSIGEGNGLPPPTSSYYYSVQKASDVEINVPNNTKNFVSMDKEEPKFHVHEKNKGDVELNFDSWTIVQEPNLKDHVKAKIVSKAGNTSILRASSETENRELPSSAVNSRSPWKKPEVQLQQEASEVPKNQVQREKYKTVSDRISFWEGEKAATKLPHKEPTSSCSQEQSSKAYQPVKSQGMAIDSLSLGQNEYSQVTAKRVFLDDTDEASHLSSFYSSNKPEETRLQISDLSKNYSSADQSDKVSLFQNNINEPMKRLPVEGSLSSRTDSTLPALQHLSITENEIQTPLEKDRFLIGESNASFKVMSLKERMDEPNTEQVYSHSQFENLRKFWDLGANLKSKNNNDNTTSPPKSVPFNSQKHKEFNDIKPSGKNTPEVETLLSQKNVITREEMEKLNSECTLQVLPDEATFPLKPPKKSTLQLAGNELSKENVEKNMEWFVTPVNKEEKDYSGQEIQEPSIVKTRVLSIDYKDTLNDSLQKLLSEASLPAVQPSGGKVHQKQIRKPGVSENRTWPSKRDFTDTEEDTIGPKEITDEHVDKTVAPPKAQQDTLAASLDRLLKEATESSQSPLQPKLEPVFTRTNSQPKEGRLFEKEVKQNHNTSIHQREKIIPFPEGDNTLGNTALTQKAESGECQLNTENLLHASAEGSPLLEQAPHHHRKGSFEDVVNLPQDTPFYRDAHLAPQDRALPSQREISETVEKVILPSKLALNDVNAVLQRLFREAWLNSPSEREVGPGEVKAEFPEGVQTAGSEEEPSPVLKTLERSAARKMPSKSLEDISSDSSNQAKVDNLPEELVHSAEDVSTVPSQPDNQFSHPDKLKRMSKSVPELLQDEVSGSVMSIYSGDFGNLEVKGHIQFAVDYVESLKELHVFVAQCKDLAAADVKKQRSDPYVKTYLLPDKGKMGKKKTLVVKKTLNPVYNEILRYKIEKQILKTQKLNVSVWHRDTFKRNSFLGEVELDLETWAWDNKQNKQLKWYPLKRKTAPIALEAENRGEMKLALQYVPEPIPGKKLPTTGEVHIWVKECLDLPLLRGSHLNSFVKCTILPDTSRKSRQKTRAVGKTTNPIFNHTMVYDGFRPEDLMEACVELTVWDHHKLTNQFLGGLRIGFGTGKSYGTEVDWMDSTSEEAALWEKMVNFPNTWIEATLPLRMLLIAKISK
ncbi:synaptotagmin-like protein 2 isoform X2 [Castor canadensis]|uniref:Synaptotagmin-like protein 2 isoform X2 n=1 Tax=Castor canadensis TaxID=51338 RepID=A0AC58N889_CASCN